MDGDRAKGIDRDCRLSGIETVHECFVSQTYSTGTWNRSPQLYNKGDSMRDVEEHAVAAPKLKSRFSSHYIRLLAA